MSDPANPTMPERRVDTRIETDLRQAGEQVSATARDAREDLRAAAAQAREAASQAASTVTAEASAAAETIKKEGAALLDTARERAEGMAQDGQRAGAEQAQGVARAVHRAADELQRESPELARVIHDAAGSIDGIARALRDRSPGEMLRSAEDWARRQPLAFFGAAALAGFALSRFARSSAAHRHDTDVHDTDVGMRHDMGMARPGHMTPSAGMGIGETAYPHGPAAEQGSATGAPGWVQDEAGTPRPATLASASLGGAASYRPRGGSENG